MQEASRKDPQLRRVLSHAKLLDYLFIELSCTGLTWDESNARDEVLVGSEEDRCDLEDSDDSDSDSDPDSDPDSEDSDSDSDSGSEWRSYAYSYGAEVESVARDWAQIECWEAAKLIVGERPVKVSVQEVGDEIET